MKHFDEAIHDSIGVLRQNIGVVRGIERSVLIDDLFGKIRALIWTTPDAAADTAPRLESALKDAGGPYWSGEMWTARDAAPADTAVYDAAWNEAVEIDPERRELRRLSRYRTRGFWLDPPTEPVWELPSQGGGTPVIAFYSFKGGVGRTTALSAFAVNRARRGERVAVLDLDLDAPGAGTFLSAGDGVPAARWGVVDFLIESRLVQRVDLPDYYHACAREHVTGSGEILVFPAGSVDDEYLKKLARLDLEPSAGEVHPLIGLLKSVRSDLAPRWILLDCRAGLSEAAGFALSGMAHLSVLFGTLSEQSWAGLRLVLQRLGELRLRGNPSRPQADCLVVQAMVPADAETGARVRGEFSGRAADEFAGRYYAENPTDIDEDQYWSVADMGSDDAPHVPVAITYKQKLATVRSVDDVADDLAEDSEYCALAQRIASRYIEEET